MNVQRIGSGLLSLAVFLTGCASSGSDPNPQGFGTVTQQAEGDDLPEWAMALPEGTPPFDTEETAIASLYLAQGAQASDATRSAELYQQALDALLAGIQLDSTNAMPYFQAGLAYEGLGDLEMMDEMFDRAEAIYPRFVVETDYHRELAWIEAFNEGVEIMLADSGDPLPALERAHTIFQGRPEAMLQLGGLYAEAGRTEDAVEVFLQAIEVVDGSHAERLEDPALLEDWQEARQVAVLNAAQLLFQEERYAESAEFYEDAREAAPDDLSIISNLAAALTLAGETAEAEAIYSNLLARPDLNAIELKNIGTGLSEGGNEIQAARAFARAGEMIPQDRDALYNEAQSLYFAADAADSTAAPALWSQALEAGRELIEVDTHSRNAYRMLITALARLNRENELDPVLASFEALPFEVTGIGLGQLPDGWAVAGRVTTLAAGSPGMNVNLRMHFYDMSGSLVGSEDFTVTLAAVDASADFQADLVTDADVGGYRYELR